MTSDFTETLELIIFGMFILSVLVDLILSELWNKTYFTSGLPLFIKKIPVGIPRTNIPPLSRFETEFRSSWTSSIAFKEIEQNIYGFREKSIEFRVIRYSPLMHGMILFDFDNNQVIVKGFVNWSILCFSLIWIGGVVLIVTAKSSASFLIVLAFIVFFTLILGILYLIQYGQFTRVAEFAAKEWAIKHVNVSILEAAKKFTS